MLFEETGRNISDDEFQKYIHGRNADVSLTYFLQRDLTKTEVMELEEEKEVIYRRLCLESDDFRLAEGLPQFLDELKEKNIPHTIATASALGNVRFFFEYLRLGRWFRLEDVVYNDGTFPGKPAPDIYLKAANSIHTDISDCIVFEDASSGIESAKRAGAGLIIGVASMMDRDTLLDCGASITIKDYHDLKKGII